MEHNKAKEMEEQYSKNEDIGSYMFFFEYLAKKWCVDATAETPYKGRLVNHSKLRPNLKARVRFGNSKETNLFTVKIYIMI